MFRVSQLFLAILVAFCAPLLQAECIPPEEVAIPDGAASTYEDMRDSETFVKEYMAEMEAYLKCLEQQDSAMTNELSEEDEQMHKQRRHAAIDAKESVAARFNEQVSAYKKANP